MPIAAPELPTDVAALQAMVLANAAELVKARAGIVKQRFEIEALKARLAKLLRMTFGRSSEKLSEQIEQLELTLTDIDERLACLQRSPRQRRMRPPMPASRPAGRCPRRCRATWSSMLPPVATRRALVWPAAACCGHWART